jgi:hypothetical protein
MFGNENKALQGPPTWIPIVVIKICYEFKMFKVRLRDQTFFELNDLAIFFGNKSFLRYEPIFINIYKTPLCDLKKKLVSKIFWKFESPRHKLPKDTYYFDKELIKCEFVFEILILIPYDANQIINKNLLTFINHSNIDSKQLQWCLNVWHTIVKLLEDLKDGLGVNQVF